MNVANQDVEETSEITGSLSAPDQKAPELPNSPDSLVPERLSLRLSQPAREVLARLAELRGEANVSELIRRALGTELMLAEASQRGETLFLERPDGRLVELRPIR